MNDPPDLQVEGKARTIKAPADHVEIQVCKEVVNILDGESLCVVFRPKETIPCEREGGKYHHFWG